MRVDSLPGLEAFVTDTETSLHHQEYAAPDSTTASTPQSDLWAVKYIEASVDQKFIITVAVDESFRIPGSLQCRTSVDGKVVSLDVLNYLPGRRSGTSIRPIYSANGTTYTSDMVFSSLETTVDEEPMDALDLDRIKYFGEIRLDFIRCMIMGPPAARPAGLSPSVPTGISIMPEKALKGRALSRAVSYTPPVQSNASYVRCYFPWGTAPLATFVWKYRSQLDLEIEGVLSRASDPPLLEEKEPDHLTIEEAREVIRRQRALLNAQRDKIKREPGSSLERERRSGATDDGTLGQPRQKRARTSAVEVVDLSGDD